VQERAAIAIRLECEIERGRNAGEGPIRLSARLIFAFPRNRGEGFGIKLDYDAIRAYAAADDAGWKVPRDAALHHRNGLQYHRANHDAGLYPRLSAARGTGIEPLDTVLDRPVFCWRSATSSVRSAEIKWVFTALLRFSLATGKFMPGTYQ
jgi:hypothetical protein